MESKEEYSWCYIGGVKCIKLSFNSNAKDDSINEKKREALKRKKYKKILSASMWILSYSILNRTQTPRAQPNFAISLYLLKMWVGGLLIAPGYTLKKVWAWGKVPWMVVSSIPSKIKWRIQLSYISAYTRQGQDNGTTWWPW